VWQNMFNLMQQFGGLPQGPPEPIVKMKAGKMQCAPMPDKPGSFMVSPIRGRGEIQLIKNPLEQVVRFQWKSRVSNTVDQEIDWMMLPNDANLTKVDTQREGDRVVLLQFFSNPSRRFFFWLQDKEDSEDEELLKKFNDTMISNGDAAPTGTPAATPAEAAGSPGATDRQLVQMEALQNVLSGMGLPPAPTTTSAANPSGGTTSASQPAQQSSTSLPATGGAPTTSAAATAPSQGITAEALQAAMMSVASAAARARPTPLQDIVTADEVDRTGILADPAVQEQLLSALPEGHQTPEELHASVRSPQFQQTLTALSGALQTENYNSIFANFGLDASAGAAALARGDGIQAFLDALNAQADQEDRPAGGTGEDGSVPGDGEDGAGASS